jgi:hypothetical protein
MTCSLILAALTAGTAAGVVAGSVPAKKLHEPEALFDFNDRPLPAERLIVDALAQYRASNDLLGLANGYRVYALFFRSRSLTRPDYQQHYSQKGFVDPAAMWANRYATSIDYLRKAEAIRKITDHFDLLSNVYLHITDDFLLMHDLDNACKAFDQSWDANAEFSRRHPATAVRLPAGSKSFDDTIAAAKKSIDCTATH